MLFVAWWARRLRFRYELHILPAPAYYVALALSLLATAMVTKLSDHALPPALALVALALTFTIYRLPLPELPVMAQGLLLGAQALVLFPAETGEEMPAACTLAVAAITLVLLVWWSRERRIPGGGWIVLVRFVYALALVGLTWHAVRPELGDQSWMVASALLAFAFLTVGALVRIWPLAAMGQLFLLASLEYFFFPERHLFPLHLVVAGRGGADRGGLRHRPRDSFLAARFSRDARARAPDLAQGRHALPVARAGHGHPRHFRTRSACGPALRFSSLRHRARGVERGPQPRRRHPRRIHPEPARRRARCCTMPQ